MRLILALSLIAATCFADPPRAIMDDPATKHVTNPNGFWSAQPSDLDFVAAVRSSLENVVAPGTATKVTYDAKGRITGSNNLSLTDIPDLSSQYLLLSGGTMGGPITNAFFFDGTKAVLTMNGGFAEFLENTYVSVGKSLIGEDELANPTWQIHGTNGSAIFQTATLQSGMIIQSNAFPIASFAELGNCGCCLWMSNATLYWVCTNSIDGNATTNKAGGK